MAYFIGIDPGISGGIAFISGDAKDCFAYALKDMTPMDIVYELELQLAFINVKKCIIEAVHSMPKQGVKSTFTFGQNYGMLIGILSALKIPYDKVSPVKWQTFHNCRTGGDKNVSKAKAQQFFPKQKITHAIADALLIADYARQNYK
jgi:Holliday junction resolvasome RuvABC endonuclease subunit